MQSVYSSSVNGGSHSIFNEGLAATRRAVGKKTVQASWCGPETLFSSGQ